VRYGHLLNDDLSLPNAKFGGRTQSQNLWFALYWSVGLFSSIEPQTGPQQKNQVELATDSIFTSEINLICGLTWERQASGYNHCGEVDPVKGNRNRLKARPRYQREAVGSHLLDKEKLLEIGKGTVKPQRKGRKGMRPCGHRWLYQFGAKDLMNLISARQDFGGKIEAFLHSDSYSKESGFIGTMFLPAFWHGWAYRKLTLTST